VNSNSPDLNQTARSVWSAASLLPLSQRALDLNSSSLLDSQPDANRHREFGLRAFIASSSSSEASNVENRKSKIENQQSPYSLARLPARYSSSICLFR